MNDYTPGGAEVDDIDIQFVGTRVVVWVVKYSGYMREDGTGDGVVESSNSNEGSRNTI